MAEHIVKPLGHLAQDLTGKRFSRLFVQHYAGYRDGNQTMWSCLCDCGAVKDISGNSLKRGMTLSCGCLNRELSKQRATSHGMARSKLYSSWRNMVSRCIYPTHNAYQHYGGRGIKVCSAWRKFDGFYSDMGSTWKVGLEIERIDNDGDYTKSNCRWATRQEQCSNTRQNHLIEFEGKVKTLTQWSRETGISIPCIRGRLRRGWDTARLFVAV